MQLLYLSLLLTTAIVLFMKLNKRNSHNNPPGPWQLPIVGSIHHMLGNLPHRVLRDLSLVHGPIMHLKLGEISTIIISSPDAAREVMKTHDVNFSSRPMIKVVKILSYGGQGLIFAPYGDYWRQLRKMCVLELLSARRVTSFQSIRIEESLSLVRAISSSSLTSINISQTVGSLMNDIVMRAVIGNKCADQQTLLSALNVAFEAAGSFDLVDLFPSSRIVNMITGSSRHLWEIHWKIDQILDSVIHDHRERRASGLPVDDLLDALMGLQESGNPVDRLSDQSLKAVILDVFGAGTETSSTVVTWAMTELMRNPRVMIKVQSEIRDALEDKKGVPLDESDANKLSYLKLISKETMRMHMPVPLLIPRECQNTCEVMGYEIRAKTRLMVNAWAMGRDRRYWGEDAEEFRPERFQENDLDFKGAHSEFLPFGFGRRVCPGMSFGVATVEHVLLQLLCYFDWDVPGDGRPEDIDMTETFGVTARKKMDLYLRAIPCIPIP